MISMPTIISTALKLATPKVWGAGLAIVVAIYGVHLIKANATKAALIEQYKEAEKNWIIQFDALAEAKKLSEDLAVKQQQRRRAIDTTAAKSAKDLQDACVKNVGYCNTPIPPDIIEWMRQHTY